MRSVLSQGREGGGSVGGLEGRAKEGGALCLALGPGLQWPWLLSSHHPSLWSFLLPRPTCFSSAPPSPALGTLDPTSQAVWSHLPSQPPRDTHSAPAGPVCFAGS